MVTRALQLHHLDDLLHGLASSHWALEKRSLLVLGRRSISGLKRGSKCIQFLVHGVVVPLALGVLSTIMAPAVVRWFTTSHSVLPVTTLGTPHSVTGFIRSAGMVSFSISPDI